ncbi:hypothetical protein ANCDUO_17182 [Ancylostoma duodenale]|uniref:Uncharacterized protein n=1 Tax=Ancylostoma duodenale TaxID=51022 RepID=A0A0C2C8P9_9BILA|nr:hypothetical protein ANCDUO_17182 [Ancylostoma duodenale]
MSSALYLSELSKLSTFNKRWSKKEKESTGEKFRSDLTFLPKMQFPKSLSVSLTTRTIRGQDKLRRAKVRSLRITLLLILVYVITWLPNNLLSW